MNGDGRGKSKGNGMKEVYHLETYMFHFWDCLKLRSKQCRVILYLKESTFSRCHSYFFNTNNVARILSLPWSVSTAEKAVVANEWAGTIEIYWHLSLKPLCEGEDGWGSFEREPAQICWISMRIFPVCLPFWLAALLFISSLKLW